MSRAGSLIALGVLTILVPFSGLPVSIRSLIAVILGGCVLGVGISLRTREVERAEAAYQEPAATSMSESQPNPAQEVSPI